MAKLLPLHPGLGRVVMGLRPHTAPSATTHSSPGRRTSGGSTLTWIHTEGVHSPGSYHPDRRLTLEQVKPLIHSKLTDIKSAFMAADPDGTGLVSIEEFKRVLQSLLHVSQDQLDALLNQVCERSGGAVDYMQFLRSFRRVPAARRACSSSRVRRGPLNTSMSLSDIQKHLKEKIEGNLRTVIRVFRLFDYNREGHIQQHEFRRILDNYCICLTDKEFQRLWNHYNPNNKSTISYAMFLEKLGFADSHDFKIAPVCTKLQVSSRGTTPPEGVNGKKQRGESCDTPSVLPHRKLQSLFYDKMCVNSTPVWQALRAFDTTRSGLVKQDVLRAVLSSFIFPMTPHSFQKLTSRYGVKATGPVRWKHFLGHFMSPLKEEKDTDLHSDRDFELPARDEEELRVQDIYPRLKEIFRPLDTEAGSITRADLRHLLQRADGAQPRAPRLHHAQITELLNTLDPEHSGVIQLTSLERLNPCMTSAPTGTATPPPSAAGTAEDALNVPEDTEDTEQQKIPDERPSTPCAASWRTVENLLLDKLCERLSAVQAALTLCDPQHTGYVTQEDLKKVLSCYGVHISDTHFNELCKTSSSRPGNSSEPVYYAGFLRDLGVPLTDETCTSSSHMESGHTERPRSSPQSTLQSVSRPRPPSGPQLAPHTCNILDIVFRRMRLRLEQRHSSLTDRIQAVTHSSDGTLSETDVRKILEDSWVILDNQNFNKFTELLGSRDGQIECAAFLEKYGEARDRQQGSEGRGEDKGDPLLTSAEQCLAAMKTKIKTIHGDNLTAFRLMDRKRRGVVDCHDFKELYSSLGFLCREEEYQRLLHLIGLPPGGNLNYAEFVDVVENDGKRKQGTQTASVQEQLHVLLGLEARHKWADMSKVLCQFDADGLGWIHKKSLRELLFTYALPMRPEEFDQLWMRYDPEGRGCVAVCDFLEKLGFHHEGELRPQNQKMNKTVIQQDANTPVSSDAASLECIQQALQENYEGLSDSLTHLETRRDGTVTVEQLLSLLNTYSCSVQRQHLVKDPHRWPFLMGNRFYMSQISPSPHQPDSTGKMSNFTSQIMGVASPAASHLLNVSMDENCRRLSYVDFLSAFDHKAEKKSEPPPASPDAVRQIESLDSLSPGLALAKMQELVTASAPNLYKAFSAFDRSGTGTVKALEFRQVLDNFCARLSDKQYRYMLTKLELNCESCTVNWKDFLNKFQSQSTLMSADRCLSRTLEHGTKTRSALQTKTSELTEHLQQIQDVVSGHLYEITRELLDLDPSNSTTVSKEQFRQLCDRHRLSLTNDQFECVWSQMPVNEQKKLQYREFLKRFGALRRTLHADSGGPTDNVSSSSSATKSSRPETAGSILQRTKSAPQCTSRRPASVGRPGTGSLLGGMERSLRRAVLRCWKDIQRNCSQEDPLQEGHISTASFLEILQSLSISMTQEQIEHLAVKFDIMKNGCVSYHDFLRHFLLNLKPAEAKRTFERRQLPLPTPTIQGVLSKHCVEVMLRIYDAIRTSWTSIRRCFLSSDRARTGVVSVQDFRKVLRLFSVNLSEEEFFHLSSYFDANTTGKICYNNFLWAFLH